MSKLIKIKKGLNIRLKGEAERMYASFEPVKEFALKPPDFHGLVPKMLTKADDKVKVGSPVFCDKYNEDVKFVSPVSGEVTEVVRGEKRKILEIRIQADGKNNYVDFKKVSSDNLSAKVIKKQLLDAGIWPSIKMRPIDIIAKPEDNPKSIFISAFDSSPLALDYDFVIHGKGELFQAGLDVITKLTEGKVHLNVHESNGASKVLKNSKGVQVNTFAGPHPAGNVGVQIHHIDPINKGDVVWTLTPQTVLAIGSLFTTGKYNPTRVIAICGSEVKNPKYYKTRIGAGVAELLKGNVLGDNVRYISGNVLTGSKIEPDNYIGYYDSQITVIPEGNMHKFALTNGWMGPGFDKFSLSHAYPTWLMPKSKKWRLDTNLNGDKRSFVMSGEYEKVFPFNIYPVQLVKSIIINDIELMENLGIYEVAPEDFALCEFVCTSKINTQEIVRNGLDVINKECM